MSDPYISEFVYKATAAAIQRDRDDPSKLVQLAEYVAGFRKHGSITDAQMESLADMLEMQIDVPDAPDTWADRVAAIEDQAIINTDAIAELSEVASATAEMSTDNADAIADLSEIVGGLIGAD